MQIFFSTIVILLLIATLTFSRLFVFQNDASVELLYLKQSAFCLSTKLQEIAKNLYDGEHIGQEPRGPRGPSHGFFRKISLRDLVAKNEPDNEKKDFFKKLAASFLNNRYQKDLKTTESDFQDLLNTIESDSNKDKRYHSLGDLQNILSMDTPPGKLYYEINRYEECSGYLVDNFTLMKSNGILVAGANPEILKILFPDISEEMLALSKKLPKMSKDDPEYPETVRSFQEELLAIKASFVDPKYLKFPDEGKSEEQQTPAPK